MKISKILLNTNFSYDETLLLNTLPEHMQDILIPHTLPSNKKRTGKFNH